MVFGLSSLHSLLSSCYFVNPCLSFKIQLREVTSSKNTSLILIVQFSQTGLNTPLTWRDAAYLFSLRNLEGKGLSQIFIIMSVSHSTTYALVWKYLGLYSKLVIFKPGATWTRESENESPFYEVGKRPSTSKL